jgi:hypothetical protein
MAKIIRIESLPRTTDTNRQRERLAATSQIFAMIFL